MGLLENMPRKYETCFQSIKYSAEKLWDIPQNIAINYGKQKF